MKHLALFFLLFILCLPVMAQDADVTVEANPVSIVTAEAPVNTTVEDGGVVINVEAPAPIETPTPVDNSPLGLLLVVGGGFVGVIVALSLGLQVIGNRANTAANNPLEIAVIEKAYESISPAILATIIDPLKAALERSDRALQSVIDLLNKAGDKVPEASKSKLAPYPPQSGTPLETTYTSTSTTDVGDVKPSGNAPFPRAADGS